MQIGMVVRRVRTPEVEKVGIKVSLRSWKNVTPAGQSLNLQFFDDSKNCAINFRPKNVGFFEVSGLLGRYFILCFKGSA